MKLAQTLVARSEYATLPRILREVCVAFCVAFFVKTNHNYDILRKIDLLVYSGPYRSPEGMDETYSGTSPKCWEIAENPKREMDYFTLLT